MNNRNKIKGVTLIEILLVLVIITSILMMSITYLTTKTDEQKREKAVMLMQRTLTAALAYYVDYSMWPGCGTAGCKLDGITGWNNLNPTLQDVGYLPKMYITTPYYSSNPLDTYIYYQLPTQPALSNFYVCITVPASPTSTITAQAIAAALPMGFTTSDLTDACGAALAVNPTPCNMPTSGNSARACRVVASVTIPGQNLNNARSLNFAGVYHNGACVPAPTCPLTMTPSIFVAPVSVSGNDGSTGSQTAVFPVSSFTAFVVPQGSITPPGPGAPVNPANMPVCTSVLSSGSPTIQPCSAGSAGAIDPNGLYWRVCLDVVTENTRISYANNPNWNANSGSVMAVTRCVPSVPTAEPSGSSFDVFMQQ